MLELAYAYRLAARLRSIAGRPSSSATPARGRTTASWKARPIRTARRCLTRSTSTRCASSVSTFPGKREKSRPTCRGGGGPGGAESRLLVGACRPPPRRLLRKPELVERMQTALAGRPIGDYTAFERPADAAAGTRIPGGRLGSHAKSQRSLVRLGDEELGVLLHRRRRPDEVASSPARRKTSTGSSVRDNPLGRGIRFGIAEQNMAMMSGAIAQDTLPGGFRPMTRLRLLRRLHLA